MSVLDQLKAAREKVKARDHTLDYAVPGEEYDGRLVIRFGLAPYEVVAQYQVTFDTDELYQLDLDTIVKSCREILVKTDSGKLEQLVEGEKTTFADVDAAMEFEADTAREAVEGIFPTPLTIGDCAGAVIAWSRNAHRQAEEDAEGKSEGGLKSPEPDRPPASE